MSGRPANEQNEWPAACTDSEQARNCYDRQPVFKRKCEQIANKDLDSTAFFCSQYIFCEC